MNSLSVVAVIHAKTGKEKVLEGLLKGLLAPTHEEEGCVRYALHRSTEDPSTFVFIEKWTSAQALKAHLASSHIRTTFARQEELIADIRILTLDPIPGGDPAKGIH